MNYFSEIDIPLSERELKSLAQTEWSQKVTLRKRRQRLASRLAGQEWKRYAGTALSPYSNDSYSKLCAKRDRAKDLENYRQKLEWQIFADLEAPLSKVWFGSFNLHVMIEQYEQAKVYCKSTVALQEHALAALDAVEERKTEFIKHFDRYNEFEVDCKNSPASPGLENPPADYKKQTILRGARSELFNAFVRHVNADLTPTPVKKDAKKAKLHSNIMPREVKKLLSDVGVGITYCTPGEWVAALRALYVEDILRGNAPEVMRWAVEEIHIDKKILSSLKKAWTSELNEAVQYSTPGQKTVFRNVSTEADKLLKSKGQSQKRG